MSDIFLSYKSDDKAKAQIIAGAIEENGYSVWWDRVIPPGRTFYKVIEEELDAAKCVVVLWSKESVRSKWVITEATEGEGRGILIPVLIEEVKPPLAFRRIEAAKLIDWDGTSDHEEFDLLLESITRIVGCNQIAQKNTKEEKERKEKEERIKSQEIKKTYTNSIGMKFALIPSGELMMGSEEIDRAKPVHRVKIIKPFYLGIFPVTQREWKEIMGSSPSNFKGDKLPVEGVSWDDVHDFIKKLNQKEAPAEYRLPSEAEWEYAARAGTITRYSFGNDESKLGNYAWYYDNSERKTHEVGQKKPNQWGLYDMHGNVWEWVQDRWNGSYDGAPTDGRSWEIGVGSDRVDRGGGWRNNAGQCRSAYRDNSGPDDRTSNVGFRLLRVL